MKPRIVQSSGEASTDCIVRWLTAIAFFPSPSFARETQPPVHPTTVPTSRVCLIDSRSAVPRRPRRGSPSAALVAMSAGTMPVPWIRSPQALRRMLANSDRQHDKIWGALGVIGTGNGGIEIRPRDRATLDTSLIIEGRDEQSKC